MRALADRLGGRIPLDPERGEQRSVVVIGAGITGLVAAYELRRRGVAVTLYEASRRTGGNIRTTECGGFLAEHGAHSISATPVVEEMVSELGLGHDVVTAGSVADRRFIARGDRIEPQPTNLRELFASSLLSPWGKVRAMCEPFSPRLQEPRDESVESFVVRRFGREAHDYTVEPFIQSMWSGNSASLSAIHTIPRLVQMEREHGSIARAWWKARAATRGHRRLERLGIEPPAELVEKPRIISFRHGMQTLSTALERALSGTIRLGCAARVSHRNDSRWILEMGPEGSERTLAVDAVVLATPAHALAEMELPAAIRRYAMSIEQVEYPPVSALTLGFRREDVTHPLNGWGVYMPSCEQRSMFGVQFNSSLFPGRAPDDCVSMTCYFGGARRPELAREDTGELVRRAQLELQALLGVRGSPVFVKHAFWARGMPQYTVGYGEVVRATETTELANPGLYLSGNYRMGFGIDSCIASGQQVAERVATYLARTS